jgi:uncharacterized protein YgfB (UPF0149 family)
MPPLPLPDFERALSLAGESMDAAEMSECHGAACGLLCRRPDSGGEEFMRLLELLQLLPKVAPELRRTLLELHRATDSQLADEQMRLELWLPQDEEPLEDRTVALARWCSGFLSGLGSEREALGGLSGEAQEALDDLSEIARAGSGGSASTDEDEEAYVHIVEYLRMVTLLFREELRGPGPEERIH